MEDSGYRQYIKVNLLYICSTYWAMFNVRVAQNLPFFGPIFSLSSSVPPPASVSSLVYRYPIIPCTMWFPFPTVVQNKRSPQSKYPGLEICLSFVSGRRGRLRSRVLNSVWILVPAVEDKERLLVTCGAGALRQGFWWDPLLCNLSLKI
jgi:hypothetical protein